MLRLLNISNIALIDRLQVEFAPGLNVLSGETGSGKSIIIDALTLLLGERAPADLIRGGEERAFVEGVFDTEGNDPLHAVLADAGIELNGGELLIKREVMAAGGKSGRGRVFVNNQVATLNLLKAMQPHLIDLHGQGDQQSLLSPDVHLNLLDAFAGGAKHRQRVAQAFDQLAQVLRNLEQSRQSESERLQALDMLGFQLAEIEQAALKPGEDLELEAERALLANAEKLALLCGDVHAALQEDETSMLARLGAAQKRLKDLSDLDARFTPYIEQLASVKYVLDDLSYFLGDYIGGIQASPDRLKEVDDRITDLHRLKRKYGASVEEILATHAALHERRQQYLNSEAHIQQLEADLRNAVAEYEAESARLSKVRRAALRNFEAEVRQEFADVSLGAARFAVNLDAAARGATAEKLMQLLEVAVSGAMRRSGNETVEFMFSANEGEDLKPLSGVASGGELSRLMLVLKTITAPSLIPKTLIFDEIDAGIGGKVADSVGVRLKRLSETNQVLCVTHQVQLARHADAHFLVTKALTAGRTITQLVELDKPGRVEELARMIGGSEITPSARKHAQELLKTSRHAA
jgi:DNA repair protein RecN (Recombination protein N)